MELKTIPISKIRPNPFQPRETFEKETIQELADSIKASDLVQPILVRKDGDTYEIIAGERRWRAYQFAKIKEIPCIVREPRPDNIETRELSIIENWHRLRLEPIEAEKFIAKLYEDGVKEGRYKSVSDMARKTGISSKTLNELILVHKERREQNLSSGTYHDITATRALRDQPEVRKQLLKLREEGELRQDDLREYSPILQKAPELVKRELLTPKSGITPGVAKEISKLPDEVDQEAVIKQVKTLRLDELETRELVEQYKLRAEMPKISPEKWREIREKYEKLQEDIKAKLDTEDVKKRGKEFANWLAHHTMLGGLASARCPICGSNWENLRWTCHDLTIKEAADKAAEIYQESIGGKRKL